MFSEAEYERDMGFAFLGGMLLALALGLLGQWATQPTPEELADFRDRICASQEVDR